MRDATVILRPMTAADLPTVAPWFEDPDPRRFLGGPGWPAAQLAHGARAVGTMFRGARQTGAHHFLALAAGAPVGYIDCGTFDRCTICGGMGPTGPLILDTLDAVTAAIGFTIDPARRRRGLATAAIRALVGDPALAHVELFEAGVDPVNHSSRGALARAGFTLRDPPPDAEGMLYYDAPGVSGGPSPDAVSSRS